MNGSPTWKMTKSRSGKLAAAPSMSHVWVASSGRGMATSMSVSDSSKTIRSISDTVHWRRKSSGGRWVWLAGVRAWWKAYRWLLNISPADPKAFFLSKLKTWATPSNTRASPIIGRPPPLGHVDRVGQEAKLAAGVRREPLGGPWLVPDHLDVGALHLRQRLDALADGAEQVRGERAPARSEEHTSELQSHHDL